MLKRLKLFITTSSFLLVSFIANASEIKNPEIIKLLKSNREKFPAVKEISIADYTKNKKNFILVDVREAKEIKTSKIPEL